MCDGGTVTASGIDALARGAASVCGSCCVGSRLLLAGCGSATTTGGDAGSDGGGAAAEAPPTPAPSPATHVAHSTAEAAARPTGAGVTDRGLRRRGPGRCHRDQVGFVGRPRRRWAGGFGGGRRGGAHAARVRRLGAVVVSHMHADHTGGLVHIVREWRPRKAYVAGSADLDARRCAARRRHHGRAGPARRQLCGSGRRRAQVLSPAGLSGDANDDSVVLRLDAGGRRFLLTGDCTGANEAAVGSICARGPPIDVLKVSHHGSRYSTGAAFLDGHAPARPP